MRKMNKVLCILLVSCFTFILPMRANANIETKTDNFENDVLSYEYYQEISEIAQARGITLISYDKITTSNVSSFLTNEREEISYDYAGKDEKTENKTYNMDGIEIMDVGGGVSQSDAVTLSVNSCCFGNIDTAGKEEWFKFEVNGNGAHNLYTTGQTDTKVELYKRTLFGSYTLIDSNDDGGSGLNFRLELGLNTNVEYYVKVTAYGGKTGSYCMWLRENEDNIEAPNGGSWTWDVANPDPDGVYFNIDKITYLTANEAQGYYIMVSQDSFKALRDNIISLSTDAAIAYLVGYYKITNEVAAFIVSATVSYSSPTLTDLELKSIAEAGGMNADGTFSNGIKIKSVTTYSSQSAPVMLNTYASWSSSYIYGEPRYRGSFDLTDKIPMWR